jgi:deoxyxylulose-5-phosphate synthase
MSFHGASLPPIDLCLIDPTEEPLPAEEAPKKKPKTYTQTFVEELVRLAETDERITAITAGMPTGTGLQRFADHYPTRFHDVGIAEPHSVTMAAGLALGGMRPVVALYSTFSQRAFDGLVHDVCQNDLPVLLGLDRSGLVGEDGTSHQGMFMLPAMRSVPRLAIGSPKDEQELRDLVVTALSHSGPMALLYPRDAGEDLPDRWGRPSRSAAVRCCGPATTCCSSGSGRSSSVCCTWRMRSRPMACMPPSSTPAGRSRSTRR